MNFASSESTGPWWRQRWLRWAGAIAVAQVLAIWTISPRSRPVEAAVPRSRQTFRETGAGGGEFEILKRLLTPSLMPSWNDFSASAWLARQAAEVTFEPMALENRPLPPVPLALLPMDWPARDARSHGLAWQWSAPSHQPGISKSPGLPVPNRGSVRIAEGLAGWRLSADVPVPEPPQGASPRAVVVRIMVDGLGRVAGPPVLWSDSGIPEADQRALRFAEGLAFTRGSASASADGDQGDPAEWRPGLLILEWAVPPKAVANGATPGKS
ncbi:MAG: hypothetical protein IT581_10945 [Verrucomicrobiales bacterium]|nr:hypothetical protein [Verrucomicrobiales bacterium]